MLTEVWTLRSLRFQSQVTSVPPALLVTYSLPVKENSTVLVTTYLRNSNKFHIILLKVSVIACESGCRSAAPLLHTTFSRTSVTFPVIRLTEAKHV